MNWHCSSRRGKRTSRRLSSPSRIIMIFIRKEWELSRNLPHHLETMVEKPGLGKLFLPITGDCRIWRVRGAGKSCQEKNKSQLKENIQKRGIDINDVGTIISNIIILCWAFLQVQPKYWASVPSHFCTTQQPPWGLSCLSFQAHTPPANGPRYYYGIVLPRPRVPESPWGQSSFSLN